jgi:hypothetical protein
MNAFMHADTAGGTQVRWPRDGKELFYIALDGRLMAVPIRTLADGSAPRAGTPVPLFATRIFGGLPASPPARRTIRESAGQAAR